VVFQSNIHGNLLSGFEYRHKVLVQFIKKILKFLQIIFLGILVIIISFVLTNLFTPGVEITDIDFIGQAIFSTGYTFQKTPVGGLSGITYDDKNQVYYAISDDRSEKAPARFYTLKIDLSKGSLKDNNVKFVGVTTLLNETGQPFAPRTVDTEGIALTSKESVFISSEGDASKFINPFIKEFTLSSGKEIKSLPIPNKFLPTRDGKQGVRNNLAFESLTITPNEKSLFAATENALIQDGSEAKPKLSSPCRILQYNLLTNQVEKEFLYNIEPTTSFLNISPKYANGLSDLLALDNQGHFLSIERTFTGLGFAIALYQVSLEGATDISNIDSLLKVDSKTIKPVQKKLLLDLRTLDLSLDNIEGLTFGPQLPNGQRSLILISDNNFQNLQRTQILAFQLRFENQLMRLLRRLGVR